MEIISNRIKHSFTFCSCAVQSNDGEERETTVNKTEEKVDKEKIRLDALNPTAYGNVEGLNLEPGTYFPCSARLPREIIGITYKKGHSRPWMI